jgi:hypothetical protein
VRPVRQRPPLRAFAMFAVAPLVPALWSVTHWNAEAVDQVQDWLNIHDGLALFAVVAIAITAWRYRHSPKPRLVWLGAVLGFVAVLVVRLVGTMGIRGMWQ